jgi:DNA-binding response OmpR family regulator
MKRKRILLVDDAETALLMERMLLNGEPYEILVAKDGEEAVEKTISERPDLIVLDVVMPKKNGFEVCRELRARAETAKIPIILVTTRGEPKNVENGFASGCNDFITKPIDGVEFLAKIRNYLGE